MAPTKNETRSILPLHLANSHPPIAKDIIALTTVLTNTTIKIPLAAT